MGPPIATRHDYILAQRQVTSVSVRWNRYDQGRETSLSSVFTVDASDGSRTADEGDTALPLCPVQNRVSSGGS
jgi:hypothetical protein